MDLFVKSKLNECGLSCLIERFEGCFIQIFMLGNAIFKCLLMFNVISENKINKGIFLSLEDDDIKELIPELGYRKLFKKIFNSCSYH